MTPPRAPRPTLLWMLASVCVGCGSAEQARPAEPDEAPQAVTRTNTCPEFGWWRLLPKSLAVGETTEIFVDVSDADTPLDELAFEWRAETGTFSHAELAATAYTCAQIGRQMLTFSARDEQGCTSVLQLDVQCFEPR